MGQEGHSPRGPVMASFKGPGPCHNLPPLIGSRNHDPRSVHKKNPAWHFGIRYKDFDNDASPGPVHFPDVKQTRHGRDAGHSFSLYGRKKENYESIAPGPGTYNTENIPVLHFSKPPKVSLGRRHEYKTSNSAPAPNTYHLPSLLGRTVEGNKKQNPSVTIKGRSQLGSFSEDLSKTPGPCAYGAASLSLNKKKSPAYSMLSRNYMPMDSTMKPGPGAHNPKMGYTRKSGPSFSFGVRHSEYAPPLIVNEDI